MSRLDEIKARLSAATPGPWAERRDESGLGREVVGPECPGGRLWIGRVGVQRDAHFIAAAPGDVAYLVSLVERFAGWPSGIRHRIECRVYEGETPLDARCSCGLSDLLREAGL